MIRRENVIKRFIMGMSVLTAYIYYTGNLNMHDINISAEQFMCDLLNILYNMDLKNANNVTYNNSGYDLISENKKIIIQVTVTDTPEKIIRTLNTIKHKVFEYSEWTEKLREIRVQKKLDPSTYTSKVQDDEKKIRSKLAENVNLNDYTLYFMVMKQDASMQRKNKGENNQVYVCIDEVNFDKKNIWDFSTLINKVNSISEISSNGEDDLLTEINHFMDKNINVFGMLSEHGNSLNNKVKSIIKEYADNFTEKLFRHRYVRNSKVTLNRLFVEPKMKVKEYSLDNFIVILDNFLWNETKKRILFIEGDAAIGKTSLVSYLCYHYLEKDDISKAVFLNSDLVCVRLRELDFSDRNKSIQEILLEYLGFETMEKFKTLFADCILILDGADEMSMIEGIHSTGMEDLIVSIRKIFKNNKIIITSRPQFIDTRRFDARNFSIEKAEILHFDKEKRKQWLEKYESCGESVPEKTKEYIINIDDNVASGVADTPLALYLLVACEMREELQGNVWALYHEIFHNAIINTEYNENFDNSLEHPIKDYEEIRNWPSQFGDVMPGDIKYKDINGDGVINDNDKVAIGATKRPNFTYGFGASAKWKGLDVNVHFQGVGKSTYFINGSTVYMFSGGDGWGNVLKEMAEGNRWILGVNEDPNADYPRLTYGNNSNNNRASTFWLRNGAYLRLKTLDIGYSLPKSLVNKVHMNQVRIFFIGTNLLTFSKFKLWDPEMGSADGKKYPLSKTFSLGVSVNL